MIRILMGALVFAILYAIIIAIIRLMTNGQSRRIAHAVKQGAQSIYDSSRERISEEKPMDASERALYTRVGSEVASKSYDPALFAKAFSEAEGNEQKTKAIYIRSRVNELRQQRK